VIEYWDDSYWPIYQAQGFRALLGALINVAEGGLVVYGSLIGGTLGLVAFVRKYRLPVLALSDLVAPSLLLGLALGRIGCLLNGCCFGGTCEHAWAVRFPFGSPPHVHQSQRGQIPLHGLNLDSSPDGRPEISRIAPGAPAEEAGLQVGDIVRQINGTAVDSVGAARWALLETPKLNLLLGIGENAYSHWLIDLPQDPDTPIYRQLDGAVDAYGMVVEEDPERGLVISAVRYLSPAARQGLQPGQRLIAVSGRPVHTLAELQSRLDEFHRTPWVQVRTAEGKVARWPLAQPPARSLPVHPTQIYSTVNAVILCLLLLAYDPFRRRDGELIALGVTIYAITRYLLEDIRTDEVPIFDTGLSISQNVSLLLLLAIAALWFYILRRPAGKAFPIPPADTSPR
jgi:phosphatidylglycerol:prolipoprotein diacylglycerol transferase